MKKLIILIILLAPLLATAAEDCAPSILFEQSASVKEGQRGSLCGAWFEPGNADIYFVTLWDANHVISGSNIEPLSGSWVRLTPMFQVTTGTTVWFDTPLSFRYGLYTQIHNNLKERDDNVILRYMLYYK